MSRPEIEEDSENWQFTQEAAISNRDVFIKLRSGNGLHPFPAMRKRSQRTDWLGWSVSAPASETPMLLAVKSPARTPLQWDGNA